MSHCFALIPAAGNGSRFGAALPKQYLTVAGRPLIWYAVRTLAMHPRIRRVYVVLSVQDRLFDTWDWQTEFPGLAVLRCGGATRAMSVLNGLRAMAGEVAAEDWVLVHDAARPCLSRHHLDSLIAGVEHDSVGGILAIPVADTLKRSDAQGRIAATAPREGLWQAQTPQMFRHALLLRALETAVSREPTDEAGAVEALGLKPKLVEGDASNLKVTWPRDLRLAELILSDRGTYL
ncbi:2-C-methyl-D-erythritol 4-phosphate cytidylyltransferase [Thiobacter aerophilum]|uniref:2-C-methyl-D-erythritol 4-phosphate cytidylyltransferase n=1 Tax=Thiobacter aerophilum TaxID=3121275 RepID=A0ABV0EB67_9BURK